MLLRVADFAAFRQLARAHLLRNTPPAELIWQPAEEEQELLFGAESAPEATGTLTLPRAYFDLAGEIALHSDPGRWAMLYRVAYRICNENRHLLEIETDDDVRALVLMRKAIHRDIHKMRAFVRFRRMESAEGEQYVAWYRPDHHILGANERFFVDRFAGMRWAILTPDASLVWDLKTLHRGPGVPRSEAPAEDEFEDLWRAYYSSIYNPARLNLDAMRAQLPVRRWKDLPESRTIAELVRLSPGRVDGMARPPRPIGDDIRTCDACELCERATQAVLGEGPKQARIMIVGEQPGDEEDRAGRPFVGPAGEVLNEALRRAGIRRSEVYLTNAVKAFRFEERGKRRIHHTPKPMHIAACRPWLEGEMESIRPDAIVCLGASAGLSVLGRAVRINEERAAPPERRYGAEVIVTYHPAAVLRNPAEPLLQALIDDLERARKTPPHMPYIGISK
jgi:DNA polymerase